MSTATPHPTLAAPQVSPENQPYWEAAAAGRLLLKSCLDCGKPHWYPRPLCPHCGSDRTEWRQASGRGEVYSHTLLPGQPPVVVAYVRLEEGVTMLSHVVGCEPAAVRVGQPLRLAFATAADGRALPVFEPA
jgi:uncharacterized OB-fold protein